MAEPSLQQLQQIAAERRRRGETVTSRSAGPDIAVGSDGTIVIVQLDDRGNVSGSPRPVSKVPKDTFAVDYARLSQEQDFVRSKMPAETYRVDERGVEGWMYDLSSGTPYYDQYQLFLHYESGYYYVKLVDPDPTELSRRWGVHACHLWPEGKICLSADSSGGYRSMDDAYAKSALWVKGFSELRRGSAFPF